MVQSTAVSLSSIGIHADPRYIKRLGTLNGICRLLGKTHMQECIGGGVVEVQEDEAYRCTNVMAFR